MVERPPTPDAPTEWEQAAAREAAVSSALGSLKDIVSIVMALAVTNTLGLLVTSGDYSEIRSLDEVSGKSGLFAALLILNVLRFYHGNVRHLDAVYGGRETLHPADRPSPRGGFGVDFLVILSQSLLFALMSFYVEQPATLLALFAGLLFFDVIWTLLVQQPSVDTSVLAHQRRWMLNNVAALAALLVLFAAAGGEETVVVVYCGAAVVLANAVADFVISWHFYFPAYPASRDGADPNGER